MENILVSAQSEKKLKKSKTTKNRRKQRGAIIFNHIISAIAGKRKIEVIYQNGSSLQQVHGI